MLFLNLDCGPPLGNRESGNAARSALTDFFGTRRNLRESSIAQQRPQDGPGILSVDIIEKDFVHVRLSVQDGEDRKPLAPYKCNRVATRARDRGTYFEVVVNVSEEGSKDPPVDDERHNLGREATCGVPYLARNTNHIGREQPEGLGPIRNQLNFPDASRWVGPVVPTASFNLVMTMAGIR